MGAYNLCLTRLGAPADPYATGTSWSTYWGQVLFDRIGSENDKVWSLHGSFGTAFTRANLELLVYCILLRS